MSFGRKSKRRNKRDRERFGTPENAATGWGWGWRWTSSRKGGKEGRYPVQEPPVRTVMQLMLESADARDRMGIK